MALFWAGLGVGLLLAVALAYAGAMLGAAMFFVSPVRIVQWYSPAMSGVPQKDFEVLTEDGVAIRGWTVEAPGDIIVLFVHGYMMNRCEFAPYAPMLTEHGVSTVYFDTRAHGRSGGRKVGIGFTEQADVRAVIEHLRQHFPGKRFVLVGSSMGSVASIYACQDLPDDVAGLILDAPYSTLTEAVKGWWSFCGYPHLAPLLGPVAPIGARLAGLKLDQVRPIDTVSQLKGLPVLLLTGDRDPIATPERIHEMARRIGPTAQVHVFADCTHGQIRAKYAKEFRFMLQDFIASL